MVSKDPHFHNPFSGEEQTDTDFQEKAIESPQNPKWIKYLIKIGILIACAAIIFLIWFPAGETVQSSTVEHVTIINNTTNDTWAVPENISSINLLITTDATESRYTKLSRGVITYNTTYAGGGGSGGINYNTTYLVVVGGGGGGAASAYVPYMGNNTVASTGEIDQAGGWHPATIPAPQPVEPNWITLNDTILNTTIPVLDTIRAMNVRIFKIINQTPYTFLIILGVPLLFGLLHHQSQFSVLFWCGGILLVGTSFGIITFNTAVIIFVTMAVFSMAKEFFKWSP